MTELRDYQRELLGRVETALAPDRVRVMMQLPTGGGKTIIAAHLLVGWLRNGRKAVWLTHRKELAEQTSRMLNASHISAVTNLQWNPGTDAPHMSQGVVILMAQTVSRRTARRDVWNEYGEEDLLVIDEAHHAAGVVEDSQAPLRRKIEARETLLNDEPLWTTHSRSIWTLCPTINVREAGPRKVVCT